MGVGLREAPTGVEGAFEEICWGVRGILVFGLWESPARGCRGGGVDVGWAWYV